MRGAIGEVAAVLVGRAADVSAALDLRDIAEDGMADVKVLTGVVAAAAALRAVQTEILSARLVQVRVVLALVVDALAEGLVCGVWARIRVRRGSKDVGSVDDVVARGIARNDNLELEA